MGPVQAQRALFNVNMLATEGSTLEKMRDYAYAVHRQKPDLIILQGGMEDVLYSDPAGFRTDVDALVQVMQNKNVHVILCTPPPIGSFEVRPGQERSLYERSRLLAEAVIEVGEARNLPVVDVFSMLNARGPWGLGEVLSSAGYMNSTAQRMTARLLYGLITQQKDLTVWTKVPYR